LPNQTNCSRNSLEKKIKEFISKGGNRFYLHEMIEEVHISLREAENFLIPLLEENKIEGKLELKCPNCEADQGTFKKYYEIPEEVECEICGYKFSRSDEYLDILLEVTGEFFRAQEVPFGTDRKKTQQT
jgi:ribosomal protein S27E